MTTRPLMFTLILAGLLGSVQPAFAGEHGNPHRRAECRDCGRVTNVNVHERKGDSNAVGLLAGGAAGALLGHQVGGGNGRTIATVAGAVGGAYAGKKIQEHANSTTVWTVRVKYDNGQRRSFDFERNPHLRTGDQVRNDGRSIVRR